MTLTAGFGERGVERIVYDESMAQLLVIVVVQLRQT
jgi:hypothetical protein